LNTPTARGPRARYALETILTTAGLPYQLMYGMDAALERGSVRCAYLVVGGRDDTEIDQLARETAVVVLPNPCVDPGVTTEPDRNEERWLGHHRCHLHRRDAPEQHGLAGGDRLVLDPAQFQMLEEQRGSGCLVRIGGDLVGGAFRLLARAEELEIVERDQHGRFRWGSSLVQPKELAARPLVSEYVRLLVASLEEACARASLPIARLEAWPRGRPMAGCLTHDVDVLSRGKLPRGIAVRDLRALLAAVGRGRLRTAASRASSVARTAMNSVDPYWTFDRISAMENRHGYRSTYYFMAGHHHPEDGRYDLEEDRVRSLIASLAGGGHEIALHGSYASASDPALLRELKDRLERTTGLTVTGHRNHLLRFQVPHSWRAQESAGFSHDSTLGYHDREGFRGGNAFPFHPFDLENDRALQLLEIPLAIMDVGLTKYRRLRGEGALGALLFTLEQARSVGGLATILWHNHTFYDPEYPGVGQLYSKALEWLEKNDAHVATAGEIDRWWRARSAASLTPLAGWRAGWHLRTPIGTEGLVIRVALPDPQLYLRVSGHTPITITRDEKAHLLEFGSLPSGFSMDIEIA